MGCARHRDGDRVLSEFFIDEWDQSIQIHQ